jgi:uncharacterized protein
MQKELKLLTEALALFALALLITKLALVQQSPALKPYTEIIISSAWLYLPVILLLVNRVTFEDLALKKLSVGQSIVWFAIACAAVFPVFYFICWLGATQIMGWKFKFAMPDIFWKMALSQLLLVALPEELFFRGYLQSRFNQILGKNWKFLSAQIGPGILVTAFLFAFAHFMIKPSADRLLVFFPALLFGFLREKTDSLIAPILFHFACNLTFIIFQISISR